MARKREAPAPNPHSAIEHGITIPCQYPHGCERQARHRIRIGKTAAGKDQWTAVCDEHASWADTLHLVRHLT
jgi:hypothetical protein